MLHLAPRAIDVGQAQGNRADAVDARIGAADHLGGKLRDLVDAARVRGRLFRDRKSHGRAILTSRAGAHDEGRRIDLAAGLQHHRRSLDVDVDVGVGIRQRHDVRDLRRQVVDDVLSRDEALHRPGVTDVGGIDFDLRPDLQDVRRISAVALDHRVAERHAGALAHETLSEVRTDEPQAAGDEDASAREAHRQRLFRLEATGSPA